MINTKAIAAGLVAAAALTAAASSSAETFTGTYNVGLNNTDPGLVLSSAPINGLNFNLNMGQSTDFDLFNLWTDETTVNVSDDLAPKPISVTFAFTQPAVAGGAVNGSTAGDSIFFGLFQGGHVTWNNGGNATLHFGGGLDLLAHLDNATFNGGIGGLNEGQQFGAPIHVTFTAVPEPATWAMLILGFGMVGAGLRMQRRKPVGQAA